MSNPPRCHDCNHKRDRIVSETSRRKGAIPAPPRQHKQICDCQCHRRTVAA